MRHLLFSCLAVLLFSAGCKKEQQDITPEKYSGLNSAEIARHQLSEISNEYTNGSTSVETFEYNEQGYLVKRINVIMADSFPGTYLTIYERDAQNRISLQYFTQAGNNDTSFCAFTYTSAGKLATTTKSSTRNPGRQSELKYDWHRNSRVEVTSSPDGKNFAVIEYDQNFNLLDLKQKSNTDSISVYTDIVYDGKVNPLVATGEPLLVLATNAWDPVSLSAGNPTEYNTAYSPFSYTYTYNDAGFPLTRVGNDGTKTSYKYNYKNK